MGETGSCYVDHAGLELTTSTSCLSLLSAVLHIDSCTLTVLLSVSMCILSMRTEDWSSERSPNLLWAQSQQEAESGHEARSA
jgi:hypothetical protein